MSAPTTCCLSRTPALLDHVHERGHEPGGVVCESYLTDPGTVAEEELVTALAMPLAS